MTFLQNSVVFYAVILICLSFCSISFAVPIGSAELKQANDNFYMMIVILQPYHGDKENDGGGLIDEKDGRNLRRVKRQGGKFTDSAKMSPTKVMQLYLQMFKNAVSSAPIGGSHPMHPEAIKPVVKLFKQRIIAFFFPEVGDEKV